MNLSIGILSSPWIDRLGWVLLYFLWQGAFIGLAVAFILPLLSRASSNARYGFLCAALLACGLLPLVTWCNPFFHPEAIPLASSKPKIAIVNHEVAPVGAQDTPQPEIRDGSAESGGVPFLSKHLPDQAVEYLNGLAPLIVAAWFLGIAILGLRLFGSWLYIRQLVRTGFPVQDSIWLDRLKQLSDRMQIGRTVHLLQTALVEVPMLIGWLRPVILVPTALFAGLPPDQLEAILIHELAHIRRHDYLVNLLQVLIETLLFYHPVVWWIGHKLRHERENCCDDLALLIVQDRGVYANALAALEETRSVQLTLTMAASGGSLLQRIQRIAGLRGKAQDSLNRKPMLSIFIVLFLLTVFSLGWLWQIHINAVTDKKLFTLLLKDYGVHQLDFAQEVNRHKDRLNYARDKNGMTLLDVVAQVEHENEALLLMMAGANPNLRDAAGKTPIYYTFNHPSHSQSMIRDFLLIRGAKLDAVDNSGETPLMAATETGSLKSIQALVRDGADLHPASVPEDHRPLALALKRGDPQIIDFLQEAENPTTFVPQQTQATAVADIQSAFTGAAEVGDLKTMEAMLAAGADLNGRDKRGVTALINAVYGAREDAVIYLLLLGADPNRQSQVGYLPLSWTFGWFGSTSDYMRMALIADGARTDIVKKDGNSLLTEACSHANLHAMQWMIWAGADPSKPAPVGTPMHVASKAGFDDAVELLQRNGVIEAPYSDPSPQWQMMHAVKTSNTAKIDELLKSGVSVDLVLNDEGENGMLMAIHNRQIAAARFLLSKGANPNFQNPKTGVTPLHGSTGWNFPENEKFREELLEAGANPNLPDKHGKTPFMSACVHGDVTLKITQMVAHGANINLRDNDGHTALYYAQKSGRTEAVNYLLQMNATQ